MGHRANISPPLVLDSSTDQTEEGNMSYSEDVNMHHVMSDAESDGAVADGGATPPVPMDSLTGGPSESCSSTTPSTGSKAVINKVPSGKALPKSCSTKRTKLERSLELLCDKMITSAASEMDRFFKIEEERHKREMALQSEQTKIEAERRREERQHELAVLQLLTRNAYTPSTSMQSSAGPVVYSPTGYDDPGQRDSRLFGWGYGTMGGVVDESARSYSSSESSYTPL